MSKISTTELIDLDFCFILSRNLLSRDVQYLINMCYVNKNLLSIGLEIIAQISIIQGKISLVKLWFKF